MSPGLTSPPPLPGSSYDPARPWLFDLDLWIRMAEHGFVIARSDVPIAYHRIHPQQTFERRRRLGYVLAAFRERRRAARLFGERRFDSLAPFAGLLFGLIPVRTRRRMFRLAGE